MGRLLTRSKYTAVAGFLLALLVDGGTAAADERTGRTGPRAVEYQEPGTPPVPARMPDAVAMMSFENRSGVLGLDWMSAGVPFVLGEKLAQTIDLRPVWGELVVPPGVPVKASAAAVARFAREQGAQWVWTGWVERPDWDLRLGIALWQINGDGTAVQIGEVVQQGDFKDVHSMTGKAAAELLGKAKFPLDDADQTILDRVPTADFYAFTLFGRGLASLAGTTGRDDAKAEKDLGRAVFIDPNLAEAQRTLGELYRQQGKLGKARGKFAYALELRPGYYAALAGKAALTAERGKEPQARALYEQMLALRPWDLETRFLLGKVLWDVGDVDAAFRELGRVVEREPDHIRARRILVLVHSSRNRGDDLVRELEAVHRLDPTDLATRMDLGAAYASVDRTADAIRTYEAIVTDHPDHIHSLKFLGDLHKGAGDLAAAIAYYDRAMAAEPGDPRAYFLLGAAYVEAGKDEAAKHVYRRAQRFKKYLADVYNALGAIAYREGKLGESLWYLKRAVIKKPNNPRYRYNYGLTLSARGELDDARAQIEAGLKLDPKHVELNYMQGVVLLKLGDAEGAQEAFERTLALLPTHPDARHNLGKLDELNRRIKQGEVVIEGK